MKPRIKWRKGFYEKAYFGNIISCFYFSSCLRKSFAISENHQEYNKFPQNSTEEFDLSQYTFDDILEMSADEYMSLVKEFEKTYDPFNSYDPTEETQEIKSDDVVSPLWTSGKVKDDEWIEEGCHEYITSVSCVILANDKGFFSNNDWDKLYIVLSISVASLLPDRDEVGTPVFVGHFYDPDTGKNYANSTSNTAKTNAQAQYNMAVAAANRGDMNAAYEHIGRCLHYVQDVNVPHHSANIVAPSHKLFEKYAFNNQESYLSEYESISNGNYTNAVNMNVGEITHLAASNSKPMSSQVNNILNQSMWNHVAGACMRNSARYSAMVLYRFSRVSSVPFYSS